MDINLNEKGSKIGKDMSSSNEVTLTLRAYQFFYYVLKKRDINVAICALLIILESIQVISYAFTDPFTKLWKLDDDIMKILRIGVGAPRIAPLMELLGFTLYVVIYGLLIVLIFINFLVFGSTLRINQITSNFYRSIIGLTRSSAVLLITFLLIPIGEFFLLMLKCDGNDVINIFSDSITCWKSIHFLYAILGIAFTILFFFHMSIINMYYFDPFNNKKNSSTKCDLTAESFLISFKMIAVIRYAVFRNDWISIFIMLIGSILYLRRAYDFPTYNHEVLEKIIAIRNVLWVWTYFVLLISKVFQTTQFNGQIYLLVLGYPVVILFALFYINVRKSSLILKESQFNTPNDYVQKLNFLKMLTEGYYNISNKGSKSNNTSSIRKNEISLRSYITVHEETCVDLDCPMKRFLDDTGNPTLQKSHLMGYMNQMYTEGIRKFPVSKTIMMHYVSFNYEKKVNLNFAKTYLVKLEKMQNNVTENFLLFIIRQNIFGMNASQQARSNDNDGENLKIEDTVDSKFRRLKALIEAATKLYSEFWGALSTNLTNNLNLTKLFYVGNKLNKFLEEANTLWDQDLKNRKIDAENHQTVTLYLQFLKDIMKSKKRSEEVAKKLEEEQQYEHKKTEGDSLNLETIETQLENEEMVVLNRASEKGEITIVQMSKTIITLLGYTKQEAIGARVEVLMPTMFQKDHAEYIGARIKNMRVALTGQHRDAFKSALEKKVVFVLPKMKTGYIIPANTRFSVYNDDDFTNSYIVKVRIEHKDTKSVYGYYILLRDDWCIEGISSSCLHLSITMDQIKKYSMNINYLLRNELFEEIDFATKEETFEEEPKKVYFVYPDILYPKGEMMDITTKSDVEREKMIHDSKREPFYLLTCKFKYIPEVILAYGFRLTPIEARQGKQEDLKLNFNQKKVITYDFSQLNFTRTQTVNNKSEASLMKEKKRHEADLREREKTLAAMTVKNKDRRRRRKSLGSQNNDDEDSDQKALEDNILTKEKVAEYVARNIDDTKSFIMSLYFYGDQFAYYKRDTELKQPYEDHYTKQPLIKQTLDEFVKRWTARKALEMKENSSSKGSDNTNAGGASTDLTANIDYTSDTSSSLNNIFNQKSVTNIRVFSYIMFFLLCAIITLEFLISLSIISSINSRFYYADKAFTILNALLYTKFFIQEAVMAQNPNYIVGSYYQGNNSQFIIDQMKEMAYYRQVISETYSFFGNATISFSDEYKAYTEGNTMYIRTLSNAVPSVIFNRFEEGISRIPTTIFYVSTVNDNYNQITMSNRNAYELMMNLLNDYFIRWREMTMILVRDIKASTISDSRLTLVFAISFVVSVISIIGIRQLFNKFIDDREKPIDLFLTIKKQKFEELKFSTESFMNKLLNKFFGNEENDDDVQVDTGIKISSDDIIIAKFKQKTQYKQSIRNGPEYFLIFLKIFIFFLIFQGYMTFKFFYMETGLVSLDKYVDVFSSMQYSQSDMILSCNVAKQFFHDKTIPIFNSTKTEEIFMTNFLNISNSFQEMVQTVYSSTQYLSTSYVDLFMADLNNNISDRVNSSRVDSKIYLGTPNYGMKAVALRYFELIRFLSISYYDDPKYDYINTPQFLEINSILTNIVRLWYAKQIVSLNEGLTSYIDQKDLVILSTFIVLIVTILVVYFLIWKSFEDNLKELLKTSVDLINLIPESIKYIIVQKINEEDEVKKE